MTLPAAAESGNRNLTQGLLRNGVTTVSYTHLRSKEGEYGTGHNSYIMDEDGLVWNAYHGKPGVDGPRSSGLRRVHFGADEMCIRDRVKG